MSIPIAHGYLVPARSSRGTLAHIIYIKDFAVFERQKPVLAYCMRAHVDVMIYCKLDLDAPEHGGYRTCKKCVEQTRRSLATDAYLRAWKRRAATGTRRGIVE